MPAILNRKSSPILRFASRIVFSGFTIACFSADAPTIRWPSLPIATTDGNALPDTVMPSDAGIIVGFPPCITEAAEFLVPKSIPIIFSVIFVSHFFSSKQLP